MAAAITLDQKCHQRHDSLPSPPLTPKITKDTEIEVSACSSSSPLDKQSLIRNSVIYASRALESELASGDASASCQSSLTEAENVLLFGSYLEPAENATVKHGWAVASDIRFNFAKMLHVKFGENIGPPVKVVVNAGTRPFTDTPTSSFEARPTVGLDNTVDSNDAMPRRNSSEGESKIKSPKRTPSKLSEVFDHIEWMFPTNTISRLLEDTSCCVAETLRNRRCSLKTKASFRNIGEVNNLLSRISVDFDEKTSIELIGSLMHKSLCTRHLNNRVSFFTEICQGLSTMATHERILFSNWMKAFLAIPGPNREPSICAKQNSASEVLAIENQVIASLLCQKPVTRTITAQIRQAETRLSAIVTKKHYIQSWEPYRPKKAHTPSQLIEKLLIRSLKPSEEKGGYIYMYWYPPNFGYIKIGFTTAAPEKRFAAWERKCKHAVEDANRESRYVKHVALVEKLIHAELRDRRYREVDCVCGTMHQEWFNIKPAHALNVLEKFATYANQEPYESVGNDSFTPKADVLGANLQALCQVLDISTSTNTVGSRPSPRRQSATHRRSSGGRSSTRYSLRPLVRT